MFRSRQQVDKHINGLLSRITDVKEKQLKGFMFARLYFDVKEYDAAERHLNAYLSLQDQYAPAHLLKAELLELQGKKDFALISFKRSYELDKSQKRLVLKICELCNELNEPSDVLKFWLAKGEEYHKNNPILFRLKEKIYSGSPDKKPGDLEKLLSSEIQQDFNNVSLRIKYLRCLVEQGRLNEAYVHCCDAERLSRHSDSLEWYTYLVELLDATRTCCSSTPLNALPHCILEAHSLRCAAWLTLAQPPSAANTFQARQFLRKLDAIFCGKSDVQLPSHLRVEVYHLAGILLANQAQSGILSWVKHRAAAAFCFRAAVATSNDRVIPEKWLAGPAALRKAHCLHLASRWVSSHEDIERYASCENARHELVRIVYGTEGCPETSVLFDADFATLAFTSLTNSLSFLELKEADLAALCTSPSNLQLFLWILRDLLQDDTHHDTFEVLRDWLSRSLSVLPLTANLMDPTVESICRLDVECFVLAAVLALPQINNSNGHNEGAPLLLPLCLDSTCRPGQEAFAWWRALLQLTDSNVNGTSSGANRQTLQRGLTTLRLRNQGSFALAITAGVAHHLARAAANQDLPQREVYETWAAMYWEAALVQIKDMKNGTVARRPRFRLIDLFGDDDTIRPQQLDLWWSQANEFLGCRAEQRGDFISALELLEQASSAESSLRVASIYRRLASKETNSQSRPLLFKAREFLLRGLDLTQGHPLHCALDELRSELEIVEDMLQVDLPLGLSQSFASPTRSVMPALVCSTPANPVQSVNGSFLGTGCNPGFSRAKPTPERLDSQMRYLATAQERVVTQLLEHNRTVLATNAQLSKLVADSNSQLAETSARLASSEETLRQVRVQLDQQDRRINDLLCDQRGQMSSLERRVNDLQRDHQEQFSKLVADHNYQLTDTTSRLASSEDSLRQVRSQLDYQDRRINDLIRDQRDQTQLLERRLSDLHRDYQEQLAKVSAVAAAAQASAVYQQQQAHSLVVYPQMQHLQGTPVYQSAYSHLIPTVASAAVPPANSSNVPVRGAAVAAAAAAHQQILLNQQYLDSVNKSNSTPLVPRSSNKTVVKDFAYVDEYAGYDQDQGATFYGSDDNFYHSDAIGYDLSKANSSGVAKQLPDPGFFQSAAASVSTTERSPHAFTIGTPTNLQNLSNKSTLTPGAGSGNCLLSQMLQQSSSSKPGPGLLGDSPKPMSGAPAVPTTSLTKSTPSANVFGSLASAANKSVISSATAKPSSAESSSESKSNSGFGDFQFGAQSSSFASSTFNLIKSTPIFSSASNLGISTPLKPAVAAGVIPNEVSSESTDRPEDFVPDIQFKPVLDKLPDKVVTTTGEEHEKPLFSHRAVLYRFDANVWKTRGTGEMRILADEEHHRFRIVMRRDQVKKLCANHLINAEMQLKIYPSAANALMWSAKDFSEEDLRDETLAVKFKKSEEMESFKQVFEDCQAKLRTFTHSASSRPSAEDEAASSTKPKSWKCISCDCFNEVSQSQCTSCNKEKLSTVDGHSTQKSSSTIDAGSLMDKLKPQTGSWECSGCYCINKPDVDMCPACETRRPGSTSTAQPNKTSGFGSVKFGAFQFGSTSSAQPASKGVMLPSSIKFGSDDASVSGSISGQQMNKSVAVSTKPPILFGTMGKSSDSQPLSGGLFKFGSTVDSSSEKVAEKPSIFANLNLSSGKTASSNSGFAFSMLGEAASADKNISSTKLSESDVENCEEEPEVYFKPVLEELPAEVEVKTGEEDEVVLISLRCKLFRRSGSEWKERGVGDIKLLRHKSLSKARLVMRREQVFKVICNQPLTAELKLTAPAASLGKTWSWIALNYSESTTEHAVEVLAARFKDANTAESFRVAIETEVARLFPDASTESLNVSGTNVELKVDEEVLFVKQEPEVTEEQIARARKLLLPDNFYAFENVKAVDKLNDDVKIKEEPKESVKDAAAALKDEIDKKKASGMTDFGGSVFGASIASLPSFGDVAAGTAFLGSSGTDFTWSGAGSKLFSGATQDSKVPQSSTEEVAQCEEEPQFKPVLEELPELIEVRTGEEDDEVMFKRRAKLYRWSGTEWKERGVGELKVLRLKSGRSRLLMRRDQVHKVCLNHMIEPNLQLSALSTSETGVCWFAVDYSEISSGVEEKLAAKFKTKEDTLEFRRAVEEAKSTSVTSPSHDRDQHQAEKTAAQSQSDENNEGQDQSEEEVEEVKFMKRVTLRVDDESFTGELKILVDENVQGRRLRLLADAIDAGREVCNHVVTRQMELKIVPSTASASGWRCSWSAADFSNKVPKHKNFTARFNSEGALQEFEKAFMEAKRLAEENNLSDAEEYKSNTNETTATTTKHAED